MRTMISGLAGWVRMEDGRTEPVRTIDTGITVVGTLLIAVTWLMVHSVR